jgi:DNA-binding NarL/FixJ family response regulator
MQSEKTGILIADDHSVIAQGIKLILKNNFQIFNIYECQELSQLMGNLQKNQISHLILDISFPEDSSILYIDKIRSNFPQLKILLFTMHPSHLFQNTLIKHPDILFCQKSESEIILMRVLDNFINNKSKSATTLISTRTKWRLSKKEETVTKLLIEGKSTGQIAENLNIKSNTVSTYKKRIFEKTEAKNIFELAKIFQ